MNSKKLLHIETLIVGQMATNCYICMDVATHEAIIIDPGDDAGYIIDTLSRLEATPTMIVATHGHFDHIMAALELQLAYSIPFVMHEGDTFLLQTMQQSAQHFLGLPLVDPPPNITRYIHNTDRVVVGKEWLVVIHVPGHTPGSICLYHKKQGIVFVGDTLFAHGAVGRTDFSYSQPLKLAASIDTILGLPPDTRLLAGHGEESTVEAERLLHGKKKT